MNAGQLLFHRARLTPDRIGLVDLASGRQYTYAQLNARANRIANFLRERLGVLKGDRVSILAHNGIAYIDLLYGLGKIGAVFAPLNWRLTGRELGAILDDCRPRVLIAGPEFAGIAAGFKRTVDLEVIVGVEGAEIPGELPYEDELARASDREPGAFSLDMEDPHCLLYTSGTTGRSKGAMIPHRQVIWNCINTAVSWGLTEHDISPVFTPLFHAGGLFAFLTPVFYVGGRIVLSRTFDPEESLRNICQERCTVILGVPTLFQMWLDSAGYKKADFGHVRWFISGGAPCPVSLMQAWRESKQVVFRQGYGLTEVGPNCFSMTDEESVTRQGSVGKPIFHSRMTIVDDKGTAVAVGDVGELHIAGPHVCSGYWRNPDATAESLQDGWFRTGDMARQDEDGYYYIIGRLKDMIISGGENIYAAEVESVLREHPGVADAALVGQPDEKWGEIGVIFVVPQKGLAPDPDELVRFCEERLARYKVPKRVLFLETLPSSPYGKVLKGELRRELDNVGGRDGLTSENDDTSTH